MDEVAQYSRRQIEQGSQSFARAARLFDPATRDSVYMLYAWCRHCDDVIDDQVLGHNRSPSRPAAPAATSPAPAPSAALAERVADLRTRTRAAFDHEPDDLPFRALHRVVERHGLPMSYPLDLIDGFAMDAEGRRYHRIDDTLAYCYHVAGVVGVMMAVVMGVREPKVLQRACDLGIAFQLTNIARDVIADAEVGRLYLPADWLAEAGLTARPAAVADPASRREVFAVVDRLLALADEFYESARHGIARLPLRSACAIAAARRIYRGIGGEIRARGPEAWQARPATTRARKIAGVGLGLVDATRAASIGRLVSEPPREGLWTPAALQL